MSEPLPLTVRARVAAKAVTPPILWSLLKDAKDRRAPAPPPAPAAPVGPPAPAAPPEWEFVPEGWQRPVGGWDVRAVAESYRGKWPSFLAAVEGAGPLGVDHEVPTGATVPRDDPDAQLMVLAFGYVLALAAREGERLRLLDWGGGPGHYAVLARALVPGLELDYVSRDLSELVALGRELQPELEFADDDSPLERRYDLVVASSALHYEQDWQQRLRDLAAASERWLYVTRVPVALEAPSFVVLQRAHAYGYDTEYLGWVIARHELLEQARAAGLELVRELLLPARFAAEGAPESPVGHRGYLFRRAGA
jgi:putative methyltransferase (TIGR04325 family)